MKTLCRAVCSVLIPFLFAEVVLLSGSLVYALVFPVQRALGRRVFSYPYFAAYCDYWYPAEDAAFRVAKVVGLAALLVALSLVHYALAGAPEKKTLGCVYAVGVGVLLLNLFIIGLL